MLGEIKLNTPRPQVRLLVTEQDVAPWQNKLLNGGQGRLLVQVFPTGPKPALNLFQSDPKLTRFKFPFRVKQVDVNSKIAHAGEMKPF